MSQPTFTNHLSRETSPYLRQHAHNPVDWYPWTDEALRHARELDRPIFLSIGYSACHWCHVMEHESFEDADIAKILNDHFISIKVDREERPDLDHIYMTFVQRATGHGGWPMSVFLTPQTKPFFGGTYFPPDDRYGGQMPSFRRVLLSILDWWTQRRSEVNESAEQVTQQLQEMLVFDAQDGELKPELLRGVVTQLRRAFDPVHGGFGRAPKFPHAMDVRVLLRVWKRFGDTDALQMARLTLDKMAQGGMYDQLGGGFARYSTDAQWLVPHFEKMLYDNALLTVAYVEAFQATGEPFYREVVRQTLDYVLREMTSPEGPFYSSQDADSEGVEGKFYVWSAAEVEQVLGKELAEVFCYVYDVSAEGNWEGHNILHRTKTDAQNVALLHIPEADLRQKLEAAKQKLLEVRSQRVWPGRDDKVLAAWNGLMIDAFAQASQVLDEPRYAAAAARAADFVLRTMRAADGRLLRTWGAGGEAKLNAYLEDYAFLINALISLYEATFAPRWLEAALQLAEVMNAQFRDDANSGYFSTGRDHETLIARAKEWHDSSIPSGNAMAATALLRLSHLTDGRSLQSTAEATLRGGLGALQSSLTAGGQMLIALDFSLGPVQQIVVVGDPVASETQRVLRAVRGGFRPNKVVALKLPGRVEQTEAIVSLLKDKPERDGVTTYVCENFTCQAPLTGADAVEQALAAPTIVKT
jgi:uncharacterized protein YyaL (SSP411 family)